jgi:hypothetical protein
VFLMVVLFEEPMIFMVKNEPISIKAVFIQFS